MTKNTMSNGELQACATMPSSNWMQWNFACGVA